MTTSTFHLQRAIEAISSGLLAIEAKQDQSIEQSRVQLRGIRGIIDVLRGMEEGTPHLEATATAAKLILQHFLSRSNDIPVSALQSFNRALDVLNEISLESHPDYQDPDEPDYDYEPARPISIMRGITEEDGTITCYNYTNDNLDTGYIGETAQWTTNFKNRESFFRTNGGSRRGIGHDVTVELDGKEYSQAEAQAEKGSVKKV